MVKAPPTQAQAAQAYMSANVVPNLLGVADGDAPKSAPKSASKSAAKAAAKPAGRNIGARRRGKGPEPDTKTPTFRLLPVLILVAAVMLTVRINDLRLGWDGASLSFASLQAQQPAEQTETPPAPPQAEPANAPAPAAQANAPALTETAPPPRRSDKLATLDAPDLSQTELDVLQKLTERRNALEAREKELDRREVTLKAAMEQLDRKIAEMKTLQNTIDGSLRQYNDQEDSKMRSLVKIYENMKSKEAARIFEQLDMPILLEVVERMKEQRVAPILAEMDPSKARIVTAELAQRRQIPLPKSNSGG